MFSDTVWYLGRDHETDFKKYKDVAVTPFMSVVSDQLHRSVAQDIIVTDKFSMCDDNTNIARFFVQHPCCDVFAQADNGTFNFNLKTKNTN